MGRIIIEHVSQGTARSVTVPNANFAAIEAEAASLDEQNYRAEGFDTSSLAATAIVGPWFDHIEVAGPGTITPGTSWTTLSIAGGPFTEATPGTVTEYTYIYMRFRAQMITTAGQPGIPSGASISFRLRCDINGTPVTICEPRQYGLTNVDIDCCVGCFGGIGGVTGNTYANARVEVLGSGASTTYQIGCATFLGRLYRGG